MERNNNKRVIVVSTIGAILEFYDFIVYLLLAPIIAELFFHGSTYFSLMETYAVFAIGYLFRPLGGIILGHFGDKFGRKNTFLFTIFLMTFATFFIASLPTSGLLWGIAPILLLLFRIFQGIALGGELPAAITFVYEHLPLNKRIGGCSLIFAGNTIGILLATAVVSFFTNVLTQEEMLIWGWRPPFFIGAIIGAIGIYIRYNLTDTPAFLDLEKKGLTINIPFFELIKKFYLEVGLCFLLALSAASLGAVIIYMTPLALSTYLEYKLSNVQLYSNFFLIIIVITTILLPVSVDKYNRSPLPYFILSVLATILLIFPVYYTAQKYLISFLIIICLLLSCFTGFWNGLYPSVLARFFPPNVRLTGISTSFNIGMAIGGGCTPMFITYLMKETNTIYSIPILVTLICIMFIIIFVTIAYRNKVGKSYYE